MLARDEERAPVWNVDAKESQIDLAESGAVRGSLQGISGDLFSDKKVVTSKFTADRGIVDQKTQELKLESNVQLREIAGGGILKSQKLEWLPTIKMVQASGGVTFTGSDTKIGPMAYLWASSDLKEVGTPESFRDDPKMKKLVAPLLAALAAATPGTTQSTFQDQAGNMSLTFRTWRATRVNPTTIRFSATGNPASGVWKSQGLDFRAPSIEGTAVKQADGKYILNAANFSQNVRTTVDRIEKVDGKNVKRSTIITSDSTTFSGNATTGTVTMTGRVTFTSALPNNAQWMQLTSTGGTFKLNLKQGAEQPVETADLTGPVTMRMISKRRNAEGVLETTDMTVTARRLTFNSAGREINITGNVILSGSGPSILGRMTADTVRVLMDDDGFVKEIYAEGAPGNATLREKP